MDFISEKLTEYISENSNKEPKILARLNQETHQKILKPRMLSGHIQGRLLSMISKMNSPSSILEIGTFTGYGTLCLAEGLKEDGKIFTIDQNEELLKIQSKYFEESGNVWFGSENGLSKLSPEGKWTNYNKNSSHLNKPVLTINKYGEHLLLGVYGNGLLQFNPKTGETKDFPLIENEKKSKLIFTTYVDENDIWVGGIDGPVKHYQNSTLVNSYKTGNARTIVAGNKNIIYVGSANGLFEINKATKNLKKIKSLGFKNLDQIYSLFFDKQNNF